MDKAIQWDGEKNRNHDDGTCHQRLKREMMEKDDKLVMKIYQERVA